MKPDRPSAEGNSHCCQGIGPATVGSVHVVKSSFSYLLGMINSAGDPLVEVAGAYFPAWLAAGLLGGAGLGLLWWTSHRFGGRVLVEPPGWLLPLWFVIFTGGSWLMLFAAR